MLSRIRSENSSSGSLQEVKNNAKYLNFQAQKVDAVAYRRWLFTRGTSCKALALVFWIGGRLWEVVAHRGLRVLFPWNSAGRRCIDHEFNDIFEEYKPWIFVVIVVVNFPPSSSRSFPSSFIFFFCFIRTRYSSHVISVISSSLDLWKKKLPD